LKQRYLLKMLEWAQKGVDRSPEQAHFHEFLGKALWLRGNIESSPSRREYFEKGLEEYKLAAALYPSSPETLRRYGDALEKYGKALVTIGDPRGDSFVAESKKVLDRVKSMPDIGGA
jgi:tetratricopeptide (TPR) repeat protein